MISSACCRGSDAAPFVPRRSLDLPRLQLAIAGGPGAASARWRRRWRRWRCHLVRGCRELGPAGHFAHYRAQGRAQPDGRLEGGPEEGGHAPAEMLAPELAHCLIELADIPDILLGAFSFKMNDRGVGKIVIYIAGFFQAVAQIDIFGIHKEVLVEGTNVIQCGSAYPETSAGQHGGGVGAGWRANDRDNMLRNGPGAGKERCQT